MTTKLTVYVNDSLKRLIKEMSGNRKISAVVTEALESYLAPGLVSDFGLPNKTTLSGLPSLSDVRRRRPKVSRSCAEIISSQRRSRNIRVSR